MTPTAGHTLIERYLALINQRAWNLVEQIFAPGYRYHGASSAGSEPTPPEAIRRYLQHLILAFPDLQMRADLSIVTDDYAVVRWTASGTHQGEYMGQPATGRHGEQTGIAIWRYADGQFVEGWQNQDDLALMQGV